MSNDSCDGCAWCEPENDPDVIVTEEQLDAFTLAYDKGSHPQQRFGQAFCNTFSVMFDPILFYEEDRTKAEAQAWRGYTE